MTVHLNNLAVTAAADAVAKTTAAGLVPGNILRVTTTGDGVVPGVDKALATSSSAAKSALLYLISGMDGGTAPGNGALVRVRRSGLVLGTAYGADPAPVVGDWVYLSDTGTARVVAGTNLRKVGKVIAINGGAGTFDWVFVGSVGADAPSDAQYLLATTAPVDLPNAKNMSTAADQVQMASQDNVNNAVVNVLWLAHRLLGAAVGAAGVGLAIRMDLPRSDGFAVTAARIKAILADPTAAAEYAKFVFQLAQAGVATDMMSLDSTGLHLLGANLRITGVADPTSPQDVTTKVYTDKRTWFYTTVGTGTPLPACTYNGTGVGTLTANANGSINPVDGQTLVVGSIIGVFGQADPKQNGPYVVTQVGSAGTPWILTRCVGWQTGDAVSGRVLYIYQGTAAGGASLYITSAAGADVIGTNNITFQPFVPSVADVTSEVNLRLAASHLTAALAVAGQKITNLGAPAAASSDAATAAYAEAVASSAATNEANLRTAAAALTANLAVNAKKITSLGAPTPGSTDAATAAYAEAAAAAAAAPKFSTTGGTFTGPVGPAEAALTDAVNIATNAGLGNVFAVTLAGNRTLDNPTNLVAWRTYTWLVTQDGVGNRTLAYGTAFTWPGGVAPVLSTAAAAVDMISGLWDGTKLRCTFAKGFA